MIKRYKITILAAAAMTFALFAASNSFAAGGCPTDPIASQAFSCDYSGGTTDSVNHATIMVTLSPGVHLKYQSNAAGNLYTLETQNDSVNPANKNEYGFASDYSGYYIKPNPDTTNTMDTMTFTTNAWEAFPTSANWTAMGGSS